MQVTDARLHVKAEFKSWMSDGCVRGEHLNTSSTVQSRIASQKQMNTNSVVTEA
jgi:hypothetical protein